QQHALGEAALDPQDRRAGEVHLALRIAVDVAGEAVRGEPAQRLLVDHPALAQELQHALVEPEVLQRVQDPPGAGHDAVAPALRQPPGEHLEDAAPVGRSGLQRGLQHGQLVVVREEGRRGNIHRQPEIRNAHSDTPGSSRRAPRKRPGSGDRPRKIRQARGYSLFVGVTISGRRGSMGSVTSPAPLEIERTESAEESFAVPEPDVPWVTIVHNDPVNLMSYVTYVFQTYFGYSKDKATKLMLDVHHKGRAVVSSGTREEMERDV